VYERYVSQSITLVKMVAKDVLNLDLLYCIYPFI